MKDTMLGIVATTKTGRANREDSISSDSWRPGLYRFFDRSTDVRWTEDYHHDCEAIIVPGEGKDFVPQYHCGKFGLHQRSYAVVPKPESGVNCKYLYYQILAKREFFRRKAVGSTMPSLRLDAFLLFPLRLHDIEKQDRIAAIFSSIDTKLDALRQKKDALTRFKTGLMQRLFSQELRFTRDDGSAFPDWEMRSLSLNSECYGVPADEDFEVYSSTRNGLIPQASKFDRQISSSTDLTWVMPGHIVYRPMSDDGVFRFNLNTTGKDIAVSPAYKTFFVYDKAVETLPGFAKLLPAAVEFIVPFMNHSSQFKSYIASISQGGTRLTLSPDRIKAFTCLMPCQEEQRKIGRAILTMDAKIVAVADQITHMETFKKGLLQQMFV